QPGKPHQPAQQRADQFRRRHGSRHDRQRLRHRRLERRARRERGRGSRERSAQEEGSGLPPREGDGREARVRHAAAGRRASKRSFPPSTARESLMDYAPFPLIELSGSPRERGRTHGQAAADRIKRGVAMYAESLVKNGVDWAHLEQRANAMAPVVEKFDPAYLEEMRGIAEGSGQPFAGIMLMN